MKNSKKTYKHKKPIIIHSYSKHIIYKWCYTTNNQKKRRKNLRDAYLHREHVAYNPYNHISEFYPWIGRKAYYMTRLKFIKFLVYTYDIENGYITYRKVLKKKRNY